MNIAPGTLWLRFLIWPVLVVGLLAVLEFGQPSSGGFWGFLTRVSAALVGYGVGSVVPYILSDEFLYKKISNSEDAGSDGNDGEKIVKFVRTSERDFQRTKANVQMLFAIGLVFWVANQFLPTGPLFSQYPLLARLFWISGPAYTLFAGFLYVAMRRDIEARPRLVGEKVSELTNGEK